MTTAVLSFATPGSVVLRCPDLGLHVRRPLEAVPPFAAWSEIYAAHHRQPDVLLALGVRIGEWIDGDERWLERLIAGAVAPLILEIETRTRADRIGVLALDAPWELAGRVDPAGRASASARWRTVPASDPAVRPPTRDVVPPPTESAVAADLGAVDLDAAYHLALDPGVRFGSVRRIGTAGVERPPSEYRLSVVFMAAQPDGVEGLDVDREEAELRDATGGIGMDLTVDESGTVDGLGETMARVEACDAIHVSCHGLAEPRPVLLLEDERGARLDVSADDLAAGLAGQMPSLTFLSACSTAGSSTAGRSLASDLCRRGWPAVIGWSAPVADGGAIRFAARLYRHLSRRQRLVEVMAQLRYDVHASSSLEGASGQWHQARLYLGPSGGGKLVDGTRPRMIRAVRDDDFLDPGAAIAATPPHHHAGRRRSLQRIQGALRRNDDAGVLIHGGGERDRIDLAVRIARRQTDLRRVVISRHFDAAAVLGEICTQTIDGDVQVIAGRHRAALARDPDRLAVALREILERPCQRAGRGAILLIVHGLDRVLIAATAADPIARPDADHLAAVVKILQAFRGAATESRLLITSAQRFAAADSAGDDLAASLWCESLG